MATISSLLGALRRFCGLSGGVEYPLVSYTDARFHAHIPRNSLRTIFEVGARHGDESRALAMMLPGAKIYSFECNPATIESCREKLRPFVNVTFHDHALGSREETRDFFPFVVDDNPGASSFLERVDATLTQNRTGVKILVRTGMDSMEKHGLTTIDLLCMDVQGLELEVLKGFGERLEQVRYIIMEEPSLTPSREHLPEGMHSKYLDAPNPIAIRAFMKSHGFRELVRLPENLIEDNVLYGRA
jgi:FkbM family methyltransferase